MCVVDVGIINGPFFRCFWGLWKGNVVQWTFECFCFTRARTPNGREAVGAAALAFQMFVAFALQQEIQPNAVQDESPHNKWVFRSKLYRDVQFKILLLFSLSRHSHSVSFVGTIFLCFVLIFEKKNCFVLWRRRRWRRKIMFHCDLYVFWYSVSL